MIWQNKWAKAHLKREIKRKIKISNSEKIESEAKIGFEIVW